jgi:assimilatory nitrate reductase electron transfer subunit
VSPRRVLVAGYGMAAARLAEEIRRRDPDGRRVALTIAGAEPVPAYNRVLLSAVMAGTMSQASAALHDDGWAREHRVEVRCGVAVTAVRTGRHQVVLADGSAAGYDDLVLATGSRPVLPPVSGLRKPGGSYAPGITAFRTLGDCRRIRAAAVPGNRAAVLGGGLLGVETACGLAALGVHVTVLHAAPHLMERQLDPGAAKILAGRLHRMGIDIRLGAHPVRWRPGPGTSPGSSRLYLADSTAVPCDAVIVTAGVRPESGLAAAAGLHTRSGVLVDDRLTTSDPAVHAIGDCAEHPAAVAGFVQPAWEQAAVLADLLTGADPDARYHGTPDITRLRAEGIELASVGSPHAGQDEEAGALRLEDPVHGRYGKLALRGGRVAGAIMLGLPDAAATVVQLADRDAPAPSDRVALLLGRALPPPGRARQGAAAVPEGAVMCRCNTVTKAALVTAWRQGARSVPDFAAATRAATGCGGCEDEINGVISWLAREEVPDAEVPGEVFG